jgi:hypothetical protein
MSGIDFAGHEKFCRSGAASEVLGNFVAGRRLNTSP